MSVGIAFTRCPSCHVMIEDGDACPVCVGLQARGPRLEIFGMPVNPALVTEPQRRACADATGHPQSAHSVSFPKYVCP